MNEVPIDTIAHHFGGGAYLKAVSIRAGHVLVQHKHAHDHLSYLVSGTVEVRVDDMVAQLTGPVGLTIAAGKHHGVKAITDAVWLCIHATECTELDKIDEVLVVPGSIDDMRDVARSML